MRKYERTKGAQPCKSDQIQNEFNATQPKKAALAVDLTQYAHYLEDTDLSEDQRLAFLQSLYRIACEFVMLGFDIHPMQSVKNPCGKGVESIGNSPIFDQNQVSLMDRILEENNFHMAGFSTAPDRKGFQHEGRYEH